MCVKKSRRKFSMPFFQNPFLSDFEGNLLLGDRNHIPTFVIKGNVGRGEELVYAWKTGPYDLSGTDADSNSTANLLINFRLYDTKNWATLSVSCTTGAASTSAVTQAEIATSLNANATFAERFVASVISNTPNQQTLQIRQKKPITDLKFYIGNGRAEEKLGFNARAGVAELPTFFSRHTIANRFNYLDSQGFLIQLDPDSYDVDANIIDGAVDYKGISLGYNSGTIQEDWQLLKGKSGFFTFKKYTLDETERVVEIIEYSAGAIVGDFAKKTIFTYTDDNTAPDEMFEIPHTLESGDLITP